jgi:hypothetical protein
MPLRHTVDCANVQTSNCACVSPVITQAFHQQLRSVTTAITSVFHQQLRSVTTAITSVFHQQLRQHHTSDRAAFTPAP